MAEIVAVSASAPSEADHDPNAPPPATSHWHDTERALAPRCRAVNDLGPMDQGVNGKASHCTQAGVRDYGLVADRIVTTFVIQEQQGHVRFHGPVGRHVGTHAVVTAD